MINCLEFRRQVLAEPESLPASLALHLSECAECQQYYQGLMAQEQALKAVLAVDVPEELAAEIRLKQRFLVRKSTTRKVLERSWPFALAATLLLALFVGLLPDADERLAREVLAHLEEDIGAWGEHPQASLQLSGALQKVNLDLQSESPFQTLGQISFAGNCVIDGSLAAHLVLQTERGPVTFLLMPDLSVTGPVELVQGGWQASLEPFGEGSLAVIGQPGRNLAPYQQQVRQQVQSFSL